MYVLDLVPVSRSAVSTCRMSCLGRLYRRSFFILLLFRMVLSAIPVTTVVRPGGGTGSCDRVVCIVTVDLTAGSAVVWRTPVEFVTRLYNPYLSRLQIALNDFAGSE